MNPQPKVIVFSTPTCTYCTQAKRFLREHNVRFTDVDVSRDERAARDLQRRTGQIGVSVILVNNRPIVGFDKPTLMQLLNIKN